MIMKRNTRGIIVSLHYIGACVQDRFHFNVFDPGGKGRGCSGPKGSSFLHFIILLENTAATASGIQFPSPWQMALHVNVHG